MAQAIDELAVVTDTLFRIEQAKMLQIAAEEAAIIKLLVELDSHCADAKNGSQEDMMVVQTLGADLMWQIWVGKKRAALQSELAKIMVRKALALELLRKTFGKSQVTDQLMKRQFTSSRQEVLSKRLRNEQDHVAISGARRLGQSD